MRENKKKKKYGKWAKIESERISFYETEENERGKKTEKYDIDIFAHVSRSLIK